MKKASFFDNVSQTKEILVSNVDTITLLKQLVDEFIHKDTITYYGKLAHVEVKSLSLVDSRLTINLARGKDIDLFVSKVVVEETGTDKVYQLHTNEGMVILYIQPRPVFLERITNMFKR